MAFPILKHRLIVATLTVGFGGMAVHSAFAQDQLQSLLVDSATDVVQEAAENVPPPEPVPTPQPIPEPIPQPVSQTVPQPGNSAQTAGYGSAPTAMRSTSYDGLARADQLGVSLAPGNAGGVRVVGVVVGSRAEASGVKPGDVLQSVNGQPVATPQAVAAMSDFQSVTVRRGSASQQLTIGAAAAGMQRYSQPALPQAPAARSYGYAPSPAISNTPPPEPVPHQYRTAPPVVEQRSYSSARPTRSYSYAPPTSYRVPSYSYSTRPNYNYYRAPASYGYRSYSSRPNITIGIGSGGYGRGYGPSYGGFGPYSGFGGYGRGYGYGRGGYGRGGSGVGISIGGIGIRF